MHKTHKSLIWLFMITIMLFSIIACKGKYDDLQAYVQQLQSAKAPPVTDEIEKMHLPTAIVYQSGNLRSPFMESASFTGRNAFHSPLFSYPLNMMRFIGTITKDDQLQAYIWMPDNKVYQFKIGDILGNHYGKINAIYPDHIEIIERYLVTGRGTVQQKVVLELKGEH